MPQESLLMYVANYFGIHQSIKKILEAGSAKSLIMKNVCELSWMQY